MLSFNSGDRVRNLNTRGKNAGKTGTFHHMVNYRPGGLYGPLQKHPTIAYVTFDGVNMWGSKVSIYKLEKV